MKIKNLMLAFLVGVIAVIVSGCESATPFIQINLGPTVGRPSYGPRPQPRPQYGPGYSGGYGGGYGQQPQPYPYGGGYGQGYGYGYGQPSYGGNCGGYQSQNMLYRNGWIPQWQLNSRPMYQRPQGPGYFGGGGYGGRQQHQQPSRVLINNQNINNNNNRVIYYK